METNAEHYYNKIEGISLCEIQLTVRDGANCSGKCKQCILDTIKWLNEEYKPKLKACPFCGSIKAPRLLTKNELKDIGSSDWYTVCYSVTAGGCVATSGYAQSKDETIKK